VDGDAVDSLLFAAVLAILLHGSFGLSRGLNIINARLDLLVYLFSVPPCPVIAQSGRVVPLVPNGSGATSWS